MPSLFIGLPAPHARIIPGDQCTSLKEFYGYLAEALDYPDDFGFTTEEVDELLSNLSWIPDTHVHLHITNTDQWLSKERNPQKILTTLDLLEAIAEDWKWAEESDLDPKILEFSFADSPRIRNLFEIGGIETKS